MINAGLEVEFRLIWTRRGLEEVCHAEEPIMALLRGRHLAVSRPDLILGRGQGVDNRGIHRCARAQGDGDVVQMHVDLRKDLPGQSVTLQQVALVEDGSLVWNAVVA